MGAELPGKISFTNCIKEKMNFSHLQVFEQFDSTGNIIYYYEQIEVPLKPNALKFVVYNSQRKLIGTTIKEGINWQTSSISLYDENNLLINYIENNQTFTSINYFFYDSNKKKEGRTIETGKCFDSTIEEFDRYDTRISHAVFRLCGENYYSEYDESNNLLFKIKRWAENGNNTIKMYDGNNIEVNLSGKTLFNKGFTKIQMVVIFRLILAGVRYDD